MSFRPFCLQWYETEKLDRKHGIENGEKVLKCWWYIGKFSFVTNKN
ncbi:hypothetical protein PAECIP112173_03418 [Paenibacillus sp. JJ-100]|nr:hypothetical protein PAECIP112173_03418 [Paenibacillus sp. JJ-100]